MHLPYAVCVPLCLGLLAVRSSAMVNNSNNSSRSSPPDESRIPQRRALACEDSSGVPGDSAPGERNFQRERAFSEPSGVPTAMVRVTGRRHTRGKRSFFGSSGTRELEPGELPDLVPLGYRPTTARSTPTTADTETEGAMPLTRAGLRAERMAKHAVDSSIPDQVPIIMWFFSSVPSYHGMGKVVVVTGCDHGIGNASAKQLSSLGYTVIAGCLTDEGASKLQEKVTGIRAEKCDITKTEDVARLVSIVETEYDGELHAVVNNAGIVSSGQALIVPLEAAEKVVTVNLLGTMRMTKMFLPLLVDNPGSRIVFVSSIAGLCPMWGGSSYTASKFGIEGYARVLREELHVFDVQVSVVNPGFTDTNMVKSSVQPIRDNFEACPDRIKKLFGLDYADRCCEHAEKNMSAGMDDASVPVDCVCKAVGSMAYGNRYYSGLMAKTVFRIAAIFPAFCSFLSRFVAVLPAPEK